MDYNNFQRIGSESNAQAGSDFEETARAFFQTQGISLTKNFPIEVGVAGAKKARKFDLGSQDPPIIVECKSSKWTQGGNIPSAKVTVWNEAMYFFHLAPEEYRKIFFVLKDTRSTTCGPADRA